MLNLIKKDYLIVVSSKWMIPVFTFFVPLIIFSGIGGESTVYLISISTVFIVTIQIYRDTLITDILVHSLPIEKHKVVISKYIFMLFNYILVNSYILFVTWILLKLNLVSNIKYLNLSFGKFSLLATVISLGVALPAYYGFSPASGNRAIMVVFVLTLNLLSRLFEEGNLNQAGLSILGITNGLWFNIGIILFIISSILISIKVYKKKQLY